PEPGSPRGFDWLKANTPTQPNAVAPAVDGNISEYGVQQTNSYCVGESANDTTTLITEAYNFYDINTYEVGMGTVHVPYATNLNTWAVAGKATSFYPGNNAAAFTNAIEGIIQDQIPCELELELDPPNPDVVRVEADGNIYLQIDQADCASSNGWYFSSTTPGSYKMTLCGDACGD